MEKVHVTKSSITFAILFITGLIIIYYSRYVFISSLIGIGLGVLFFPIINKMRNKLHLPRGVSALFLFLGFMLIVAAVVGSFYYLLNDQLTSLTQRWPQILQDAQNWAEKISQKFPWIQNQVEGFDFAASLKQSAVSVLKGFKIGLIAVSGALLILVIGLYTSINGKEYFNHTVEAFYPRYRNKAKNLLQDCAKVLRQWVKAQLIDMVIIGVLTGLGLWIAGVEYWAIFGLLTAILGIIPYIGILIVVTITSLITLSSDPTKIMWVLVVFGVTQQLEADVILPMVLKGGAQLPVVPLLIFMMFLGTFFGILGVFIAPPLLAVLRTIYIELYLPSIQNR